MLSITGSGRASAQEGVWKGPCDVTKRPCVSGLGTIARKLLEAVDIIQKSSSAELGRHTEQWKIQWHVEAYMFISNRMEMQDTKTFHSLAACNR